MEEGRTLGEAGIPAWEEAPDQGRWCMEGDRPEGEGGTGLELRTPVRQEQEVELSGDDWSCALWSYMTCPMIYVLHGVTVVVLGVLIDVKTCVGEGGDLKPLNGCQHCCPALHGQSVPEVLFFAQEAAALTHQVEAALRGSWCA